MFRRLEGRTLDCPGLAAKLNLHLNLPAAPPLRRPKGRLHDMLSKGTRRFSGAGIAGCQPAFACDLPERPKLVDFYVLVCAFLACARVHGSRMHPTLFTA